MYRAAQEEQRSQSLLLLLLLRGQIGCSMVCPRLDCSQRWWLHSVDFSPRRRSCRLLRCQKRHRGRWCGEPAAVVLRSLLQGPKGTSRSAAAAVRAPATRGCTWTLRCGFPLLTLVTMRKERKKNNNKNRKQNCDTDGRNRRETHTLALRRTTLQKKRKNQEMRAHLRGENRK